MEEVAGEFAGKVQVFSARVQETFGAAADLGIMAVPTLVFFKDGQEVGRHAGALKKDALVAKMQQVLGV